MIRAHLAALALGASLSLTCIAQGPTAAYLDASLSPQQRAHDLVARMTLQEKAEQSMNNAPAIPRLGVPAYDYWSEGLHGVARSGYATLFPQAIGLAATWDGPLVHDVGETVSTEARAKYNQAIREGVRSIYFGLTIWSPNINIFRDPRWGRGQETYGEDPFLTGELGTNFIRGLQGPDPDHPRAIATPKHFAVHSGPESTRHSANVDSSPHDLWETYLPQFRRAIVEGHAQSIMCAYNAIYGKPACASDLLLKDVLRGDWGFKGFVTSDCGAIDDFFEKGAHTFSLDGEHAAAAGVQSGTDTNCGTTYKALPAAVKAGLLTEADLDRTVERLFVARIQLGLFDAKKASSYSLIPFNEDRSEKHLELSLRAARESLVLLKNDGTLPIPANRYKRIAVVGPNAASLAALEGNYNAVPRNPQMPVEALRAAFKDSHIIYVQGAPYADGVPLPVPSSMLRRHRDAAEYGLSAEYFAVDGAHLEDAFNTRPVAVRTDTQIDFDWNSAAPVAEVKQDAFAVRWTGFIVPPQTGQLDFDIRLAHCYPCNDKERIRVKIDGKEVNSYATLGGEGRESTLPRFHVPFVDTRPHPIEVDYIHQAPLFGGGITMEWIPPAGLLQKQAAEAARQADLVIALVGLSAELEGEEMKIQVEGFSGGDRTEITLPASQEKLLRDVGAAGKPVVVVLLNGSAVASPWARDNANAILEAWYPGEFGGRAIAETLLGVNNPAGRLPVTFYNSSADLPRFDDYSMKNRTYRYFTGTPFYSFGYGLSYTKFAYTGLSMPSALLHAGESLTVQATVKNTGAVAGDEVSQLYLIPPPSGNGGISPRLRLAGFQRMTLQPGETRRLLFTLSPRDLSEVDANGLRSVQAGEYTVAVGGSQPRGQDDGTSAAGKFTIEGTQTIPR